MFDSIWAISMKKNKFGLFHLDKVHIKLNTEFDFVTKYEYLVYRIPYANKCLNADSNQIQRLQQRMWIKKLLFFCVCMRNVHFFRWKKKWITANLFRHRIFLKQQRPYCFISFTEFRPCLCHSHSHPITFYTSFGFVYYLHVL